MEEGVLRRSLRRINPFRNKLFRLPATPRLARSRKVGNGEEVGTEWNFERASFRDRNNQLSRDGVSISTQSSLDTVSLPISPQCPPTACEAESSIHEHMRSLLVSSRGGKYLQLPQTRYAKDGEISNAYWTSDRSRENKTADFSSMSMLNMEGVKLRDSQSRNSTLMSRTLRSQYPLNGLSRPPSTDPARRSILPASSVFPVSPLFQLGTFSSTQDLEETFIAREWLFRELYQAAIVEKTALTIVEGAMGAGKTAVFNQLVLHSSFYSPQTSDTLDSGCCVAEANVLTSKNYEWLVALSSRVVAYHISNIHSAASCSIPEFVCNIASLLASSPVLKSYAQILLASPQLLALLQVEECCSYDALTVFNKVVVEPLQQLTSTDQGCLVILVDGLDEANFHRCEDGRSIASFLTSVVPLLPSWLRIIVSATPEISSMLNELSPRIIRIDNEDLDERVVRDCRMLVEYRISAVSQLEETIFAMRRQSLMDPIADLTERVVASAKGNMQYIRVVLHLLETGKMRSNSVNQALPENLSQLYTLYMQLTFTSEQSFSRVVMIFNVLLAALAPLDRTTIFQVLNAAPTKYSITHTQLSEILTISGPLITFTADDKIILHHTGFRHWLLASPSNSKYAVDVRSGHMLHALWLSSRAPLASAELFELSHHLLKAHPYKYMQGEYVPELTTSKDGQMLWVRRCSSDIAASLQNDRNMHYSNTKVSRLLLLAGADPSYPSTKEFPLEEKNGLLRDVETYSVSQKACAAGHWPLVQLLLHYGAGLHPHKGDSLLTVAAGFGHISVVRQLEPLDGGRSLSEAVLAAASHGHPHVLSFLLSCEWPTAVDRHLIVSEAVVLAATQGHSTVCQYLVDTIEDIDLSRPMQAACENGRAHTVQFFLARGCSLSTLQWPDDRPALHCAVESGSWDLVVAVLSLPETTVDCLDGLGRTALMKAASCGHVALVDLLLNRDADLDAKDDRRWSAVMHATAKNQQGVVQLFIDRKAQLNGNDVDGNTVAHIGCRSASKIIVDALLQAGTFFEEKNNLGDRPVETAIRSRNRPALEALLRRGARLRSSTWTAALSSDPESVFLLLQKLLDDASLLFRKRKLDEAMHRLQYALNKCEAYVSESALSGQQLRLSRMKMQVLLAMAKVHRREGSLERAISGCNEANALADSDDLRFEVLLLRAKCLFDAHDVDRARLDALEASHLRPTCEEAQHLLTTLCSPPTAIARF